MAQATRGDRSGRGRGIALPFLVILRCTVAVLSTAALILVARNKQNSHQLAAGKFVLIQIKSSDDPGLVFFAYASGIVAIYSALVALSCVVSNTTPTTRAAGWILLVADQTIAYLMMASASAATEVWYLSENGSSKSGWDEKCSTFGRFCMILKLSILLYFVALLLQASVSVMSARRLFKRYVKISSSSGQVSAKPQLLPEAI